MREAALPVVVQPLAAAFEVKKTADCREALPGDRITYQIAIHNTGERTLHSVLTTERFLHSNIRAAFLETEGVSLNGTKTQASIPAISPGGCVCLKAVVVLPEELKEQELINQVIVTTEETGEEEAVHAQAEIKVREKTAGGGGAAVRRSQIYRSSSPKTGDDTPRRIFEILMLLSVLASAGAARRLFLQRKEKSRH